MYSNNFLGRGAAALLAGLWLVAAPALVQAAPAWADLQAQNGGRRAAVQRFLTTTEKTVIFTFGGLSRQVPLRNILDYMAAEKMRGTFFVTERELQRNLANVQLIRNYGQDLAMGLVPTKTGGFQDYCAQIQRLQQALRDNFGVDSRFVRIMSGGGNQAAMEEAVSAMGCTLVGQGLNVVQSKHKDARSPAEVMPQIFGKWTTSLNRGEIVYMRTDFYTNDALAADMLRAIKTQKLDNIAYAPEDMDARGEENDSAYHTSSLAEVDRNKAMAYRYPVDTAALPTEMQPEYGTGQVTAKNFAHMFFSRYIGAPEVGPSDRMLGFSRTEMARVDKTGLVKTAPPRTVFLTFDDWGNDDSINKMLYVLRKHQVHGTFFIITRNMLNNPNLLRAIASEGNEIGCHTNNHVAMTVQDKGGHQVPVEKEDEYKEDVGSAYPKLLSVVGDMRLENGRPALTRLLRPPTLAVSRKGAMAVLNAGYTYIVNGSGSTEDYGAVSMQSLVGIMNRIVHDEKGNVRKGAILIMHMSSTAKRTPEALDMLLTANDRLPEGHPGKFKVGLLGDYLKDGYDQSK
ncbi:hypothetical protein SELR_02070 [Selenomonas ruminantium subsp. lactilytica TAM6421]|uniref:NodB homology domain-containing protein n=1 Tax=Selenomonas ruminantium subsp. lactilytica (strain NBRC 103574 / TAM6421) TaxID=927704 RepID=I0GMC8_SELRL|nr:polysaccharide deacetylase family protein [Selenomonas ruminantium]BAL81915.1 hypothetical protein SELR_02070 [Selenomonas ruminantium subsp. lactilytica TAM6421]